MDHKQQSLIRTLARVFGANFNKPSHLMLDSARDFLTATEEHQERVKARWADGSKDAAQQIDDIRAAFASAASAVQLGPEHRVEAPVLHGEALEDRAEQTLRETSERAMRNASGIAQLGNDVSRIDVRLDAYGNRLSRLEKQAQGDGPSLPICSAEHVEIQIPEENPET
jgi:hypothetical protein